MNTATTTPQIDMQPVESSQIHSIGHHAPSNTLAVRFKDRTTGGPTSLYHYDNVTPEDFAAFKGAESIGKHFYAHIKPNTDKHPYRQIEKKPGLAADAQ